VPEKIVLLHYPPAFPFAIPIFPFSPATRDPAPQPRGMGPAGLEPAKMFLFAGVFPCFGILWGCFLHLIPPFGKCRNI